MNQFRDRSLERRERRFHKEKEKKWAWPKVVIAFAEFAAWRGGH
jgi:hypothetical protein